MLKATKILNDLYDYADSGAMDEHLFQSMNETSAVIQGRIFDSEKGAHDSKGKALGSYSTGYAKYRASLGFNSIKKDLELSGDTRRSIKTEKVGKGGRIFLDDSISIPKQRKSSKKVSTIHPITTIQKAKFIQEYQNKKGNDEIFKASDSEREYFYEKARQLIKEDLQNLINR